MRRHAFDPLSFVFGALFLAVAAAGLTGPWSLRDLDLAWFGPALVVLLGMVVLLTALSPRSGARAEPIETDAATDAAEPVESGEPGRAGPDEDTTEPR